MRVGLGLCAAKKKTLLADTNKKIRLITYNHLNLPVVIIFENGEITYLYNAVGQKIQKVVRNGDETTTEYLTGFQYFNEKLKHFPHAEGYVNIIAGKYKYVFNYTDHLGNVRLGYSDADGNNSITQNEIIEENHYYPFGLKHSAYNTQHLAYMPIDQLDNLILNQMPRFAGDGEYNYKYNGKEYQDELGLNVYDMDMRQYDPAIARWTVMDPITQHGLSPFTAFDNNPIYWADPSGAISESFIGELMSKSGSNTTWSNNNDGTFSGDNGITAGTKDSSLTYTVLNDKKNEHQITWEKVQAGQVRTVGNGMNAKTYIDIIKTRIETKISIRNGKAIYESVQYTTISTSLISGSAIIDGTIGCDECKFSSISTQLENLDLFPIAKIASEFIGNNIEVNSEYNLFNGDIKSSIADNLGSTFKGLKFLVDKVNPAILKRFPAVGKITNGLFIYDWTQKGVNKWRNFRDNSGKSAYYDIMTNGTIKFMGTNFKF